MDNCLIKSPIVPVIAECIHHPGGARSFLEPVVQAFERDGIAAELWLERYPALSALYGRLKCPWRTVPCDLSIRSSQLVRSIGEIRAAMRARGVNVLHAHQTRAALLPLVAARLEKLPKKSNVPEQDFHVVGTRPLERLILCPTWPDTLAPFQFPSVMHPRGLLLRPSRSRLRRKQLMEPLEKLSV